MAFFSIQYYDRRTYIVRVGDFNLQVSFWLIVFIQKSALIR